MGYDSVDKLQNLLASEVFHYASDKKKAAGRALGTFKELKVLAQSYDWLIFLTDNGIGEFITDLLIKPKKENQPIKEAFNKSYNEYKKNNIFTKVKMDYYADVALTNYFRKNAEKIKRWFNNKGAPMACYMVYWGDNISKFQSIFMKFGAVVDIRNLIGKKIGKEKEQYLLFQEEELFATQSFA